MSSTVREGLDLRGGADQPDVVAEPLRLLVAQRRGHVHPGELAGALVVVSADGLIFGSI